MEVYSPQLLLFHEKCSRIVDLAGTTLPRNGSVRRQQSHLDLSFNLIFLAVPVCARGRADNQPTADYADSFTP